LFSGVKLYKLKSFYENCSKIHAVLGTKSKLVIDILHSLKNFKNILDIGCGDGAFDKILIKEFPQVVLYGVDISHEAVSICKKEGINAVELDVSNQPLPFDENSFDVVILLDVIEHLINPDFAMTEIHRVLKKDGILIMSTPNLACWYNRILLLIDLQPIFTEVSTKAIFGHPGHQPVGHLRLFTLKALQEFLSFHRFKCVKKVGVVFESLPPLLKYLDTLVAKYPPMASVLLIVAKKSS
jgi:methionine biosynthesis protein MetW